MTRPADLLSATVRWRVLAAWRVLCGYPVAFKVESADGYGILVRNAHKAVIYGCTITNIPFDAVIIEGASE